MEDPLEHARLYGHSVICSEKSRDGENIVAWDCGECKREICSQPMTEVRAPMPSTLIRIVSTKNSRSAEGLPMQGGWTCGHCLNRVEYTIPLDVIGPLGVPDCACGAKTMRITATQGDAEWSAEKPE